MSSDTVRSIFRNSESVFLLAVCVGFCSAAVQSVFFRELLSVFSGNELSIGIILSVWLLSGGAGTAFASRHTQDSRPDASAGPFPLKNIFVLMLCLTAVSGFFCIRLSRLVFGGGLTLGPAAIAAITAVSVVPFTLVNGYVLGRLFSSAGRPAILYLRENAGAVAGALVVFICIMLYAKNGSIAALSLLPFVFTTVKRPWMCAIVIASIACILVLDHPSVTWKYGGPVQRVIYGREGEIAVLTNETDTTYLVDGSMYKSTLEKPLCEQAVHIPMAQRPHAANVLVVYDRGHTAELSKYDGVNVDIIETEPAFASGAARITAVETYRPHKRYDVVFLGAGLPRTSAANRYYTRSFFLIAKSLLSDSGLISFSLPFSENYLSPHELALSGVLQSTLRSVYKNVAVFPGEGYTFMASDGPLTTLPRVLIPTKYLVSSIIPGVSRDRIEFANKKPGRSVINTRDRPITLLLGLQTWLDFFRGSMMILLLLLAAGCITVIIVLPRNRNTLSIASSGFTTGIYSVCLLLMYQATYGALYSRVSLLLVGLAAGFAFGSLIKRFILSDFVIGLYAVISLCILSLLPYPPAVLFFFFHLVMGILAAGQFVTRRNTLASTLYAADLFGGAMGMAICSTILVPMLGVLPVAVGLFFLKLGVNLVCGGEDV